MAPMNAMFKALADPTRREILRLLAKGDLPAGAIADRFQVSKPSISHHLAILKQAHLVLDQRRGQNIIYSLDTTVFQEVVAWALGVMETGDRDGGARASAPTNRPEGEDDERA